MPYTSKPGARKYGDKPKGLNFGERTGLERDPFPTHSGVAKGPLNSSPNKDLGLSNMHKESIKKDPRYGKLSSEEYKTEATRQSKHFEASGNKDWDAMGVYDFLGNKKKQAKTNTTKYNKFKKSDGSWMTAEENMQATEKRNKANKFKKPDGTWMTAEENIAQTQKDIDSKKALDSKKDAVTETPTEKPKKKGWWAKYKDFRKTREFAENRDLFEQAGNVIGGQNKFPANAVEKFDANEKAKTDEARRAKSDKRAEKLDLIASSAEKRKQKIHDLTYSPEQIELDRKTQMLNNRIKINRISDWNTANDGDLTLNPSGTFADEVVKKHA